MAPQSEHYFLNIFVVDSCRLLSQNDSDADARSQLHLNAAFIQSVNC